MRPLLLVLVPMLVLVVLAGCQTAQELGQALAPILADSVALQVGDLINQGAAGSPVGPDELEAIRLGLRAAIDSGFEAGREATEAGASGWAAALRGLGAGILGGGTVGGLALLRSRTAAPAGAGAA